MTAGQFRAALGAQPFHPFVVHLADGRQLSVQHPEFAIPSPRGRTAVICQPDDTLNIIDLMLVTDLELKSLGAG